MTREQGKAAIASLIDIFCVDDVVCWTREFCDHEAEHLSGAAAGLYKSLSEDLSRCENRGL